MKRNQGFTLVELIVVILILGILAATALPRFIDLGSSARVSSINALYGATKTAVSLYRAQLIADGNSASANNTDVVVDGVTVKSAYGYPPTSDVATTNDLTNLLSLDGYTVTRPDTAQDEMTIGIAGATTPASCVVTYTPPDAAGKAGVVSVDPSGC